MKTIQHMRCLAVVTLLLGCGMWSVPALRASDGPLPPVDMHKRAEELKNLKWGMFICWSFSTFSGKEWTPGVKDVSFFKATNVDTDQWARTAKEAGMGYILFLTKHHDGFCLWDTKTTERKVTNAPLKRDVLAELRKSCDKYSIKLAIYYSEGDWTWPGAMDGRVYRGGRDPEVKKAQLQELLTRYGPVEYIWFDYGAGDGGLSHEETVKWCKQFQPGCFIGFNLGAKAGDIRLGEMGYPGKVRAPYLVAEFTYPILPPHMGGAAWFYSLPKHDNLCSLPQHLYWDYLEAVRYGNLFSLDLGPDYQGKLREVDVATLRQIGDWIRDPSKAPPPECPAISTGKTCKTSMPELRGRGGNRALDGDYNQYRSVWVCPDKTCWLEVDLGKEERVGQIEIYEPLSFINEFDVAYRNQEGDAWTQLACGTTVGQKKVLEFSPVTARYVRLNILKASAPPSISEFRVLPPVTRK